MAQIINKIDFTCDELNTIRETVEIFEKLYEKAEKDPSGLFDVSDYDCPKEMENLYDLLNNYFYM